MYPQLKQANAFSFSFTNSRPAALINIRDILLHFDKQRKRRPARGESVGTTGRRGGNLRLCQLSVGFDNGGVFALAQ